MSIHDEIRRARLRVADAEAAFDEARSQLQALIDQELQARVQGIAIGDCVAITDEYLSLINFRVDPFGGQAWVRWLDENEDGVFVAIAANENAREIGGLTMGGIPLDMALRMRAAWLAMQGGAE